MQPTFRKRGPLGVGGLKLKSQFENQNIQEGRLCGPIGYNKSTFSVPRLSINPDNAVRLHFQMMLSEREYLWKLINKLPITRVFPTPQLIPPVKGHQLKGINVSRLLIGPIPSAETILIFLSEGLDSLATEINKLLLLDQIRESQKTFWLLYENDGGLPFNPGSGSDQGKTAKLSLFVTFDDMRSGLAKLGLTVIDMHTPRGYLAPGKPNSQYRVKDSGPFVGRTSVDFEVILKKTGSLKVNILGSIGVDSSDWGKLVQGLIHTKISGSPLFPWPKRSTKLFAEIGSVLLLTPKRILYERDFLGLKYNGKIEFDAKAIVGTHRTEAAIGARVVLRTATVSTKIGDLKVEFSPIGGQVNGFVRYNDGRTLGSVGVEGSVNSSFWIKVGNLGLGIVGGITLSTDPSLQTANPAGSAPLLSPLSGGPKGHHGVGRVLLSWSF